MEKKTTTRKKARARMSSEQEGFRRRGAEPCLARKVGMIESDSLWRFCCACYGRAVHRCEIRLFVSK